MKSKLLLFLGLLLASIQAWAQDYDYTEDNVNYCIDGKTATAFVCGSPAATGAITIPDKITVSAVDYPVTKIGEEAFYENGDITSVVMGDNITTIEARAFAYCDKLTEVTMSSGVTSIEADAFLWCTAITDVYMTSINAADLTWEEADCDDFKSDGSTIIHVNDRTAWLNKFATVVNGKFDDGVTSVTPFSWEWDETTKTLTIKGAETMPNYEDGDERPWDAYLDDVEKVVIEDGVLSIGNMAFSGMENLTAVTIPSSVRYIGTRAFSGCSKLTTLDVPTSVKVVKDFAFEYCGFTSFNVTFNVDYLDIFCSCNELTTITIGKDVSIFINSSCPNLTTINVEAGNTTFKIVDGVLYSADKKTLVAYPIGMTAESFTVPDAVTTIQDYAFQNCNNLKTVTIGSGVTHIGYDAFYQCEGMTDVNIDADPSKLTWDEGGCDDFKRDGSTIGHVADASAWTELAGKVNLSFQDGSGTVVAKTNWVDDEYWATYYNGAKNMKADANTTVYKAAISGDVLTLTEIADKVINQGEGVILKSTTASYQLTVSATASTSDYSGNSLEGADVTTSPDNSTYNYYVLGDGDGTGIGFYSWNSELAPHKAFIKIPVSAAREFYIFNETTGISEMSDVRNKMSDVFYDLQGRRVAQPKKGVYISNGKKMVIK